MNKLIKINEYLYYLPYIDLGDRPNLYYIKGDNYSIAIDAGNSKEHLSNFYDELNENNLALPKYTIISHWHWDHSFALAYINGKSICSKLCNEKLNEVSKWSWTISDMKQREIDGLDIKFCNDNIMYEYPNLDDIVVKTCDIEIEDKIVLDLGNLKIELIPFVSTHSDDSLFVYIPKFALFVQDSDWINPYVSDEYDQGKLIKMINFFDSLDYQYHFLGHVDVESKEDAIARLKKEII